jgi:probable HAF family extracellular repeat protein
MLGRSRATLVCAAAVAMVLGAAPAVAAPGRALTVTSIPLQVTLPSPYVYTHATDVNAAGVVVGTAPAPTQYGPLGHAIRWRNGTPTDIAPPGTFVSDAAFINAAGDVVLSANTANGFPEPYLRTRTGRYIRLVPAGALSSVAYHLNDRGHVLVGWRTLLPGRNDDGDPTSYRSRLGLWRDGRLTEITRPGLDVDAPAGTYVVRAYVNNSDQVVSLFRTSIFAPTEARLWDRGRFTGITTNVTGLADLSERGQVVGTRTDEHLSRLAFSWYRGRLTDLPGGALGGSAYAVNERGQIAGEIALGFGTTHAVVWTNGKLTDLGTLGGDSSTATGINNLGQVSGTSLTSPSQRHAFVWWRGTFTDLTPQFTGTSVLADYAGITDTGYLIGSTVDAGANTSGPAEWHVR